MISLNKTQMLLVLFLQISEAAACKLKSNLKTIPLNFTWSLISHYL